MVVTYAHRPQGPLEEVSSSQLPGLYEGDRDTLHVSGWTPDQKKEGGAESDGPTQRLPQGGCTGSVHEACERLHPVPAQCVLGITLVSPQPNHGFYAY